MSSEYVDKDGYPTEEALKEIRKWAIGTDQDVTGNPAIRRMVDFIESIWWANAWGFTVRKGIGDVEKDVDILELHTGGWSGNEEIIGELQQTFFWMFYWQCSIRGGHYYFHLPLGVFTKEEINEKNNSRSVS